MQRLGDQRLVGVRPIALGRINEVDAKLHHAAQYLVRVPPIARLAPDILAVDHPHRAEAEAVNGEVANPDGAQSGVYVSVWWRPYRKLAVLQQQSPT